MFSAAKHYAMYRIANAPVRNWPFPHICVENVFPPDFYTEIRRHMVEDAGYTRLTDSGRVSAMHYSDARFSLFARDLPTAAMPEAARTFWQTMFATFSDLEFAQIWLDLFSAPIEQKLGETPEDLLGGKPGVDLKLYTEIFLMRDRTSYSLGPHTDTPRKLISVLFYLPPDESDADLGTSLYMPKRRDFTCFGGPHHDFALFDRVETMPFRPNTVVAFPQTKKSFHGVEPVTRAGAQRNLLLFDIKIKKR